MNERTLILPLHGLRGLAALTVLIGHFRSFTEFPSFHLATSIGVVLFFVLSGFLMAHLYLGAELTAARVGTFVGARFARIYPLFALVVILAACCSLVSPSGIGPFGMTFDLVLPHLFFAGAAGTVWTISVEFQFYAAFILLWVVYASFPKGGDHLLLILTAMSLTSILIFGYPTGRIDFFRYAHVFLVGVAAAIIWRRLPMAVAGSSPILLPLSLLYFLASYFVIPRFYDQESAYADVALCIVSGALVLSAAGAPRSIVGRILSCKVVVLLGELSFGMYLLHRVVMFVWEQTGYLGLNGVPLTIGFFASTMLAAWMANRWIEVPCRRLVRTLPSRLALHLEAKSLRGK